MTEQYLTEQHCMLLNEREEGNMCLSYEKEQERKRLKNDENYHLFYGRAKGKLRELAIHQDMPGYRILVQAICIQCILTYENEEDMYEMLENTIMIPSIFPVMKKTRPACQWMKEALRSVGIHEEVEDFIDTLSMEIKKEIEREKT